MVRSNNNVLIVWGFDQKTNRFQVYIHLYYCNDSSVNNISKINRNYAKNK